MTPEIRPASDDQIAMLQRGLDKTTQYTLGGFAAHATFRILIARIEADRARIAELETQNRGLTESRTNWRVIAEANDKTIAKQAEEISDLNRRIAVLESDRGKGCNPSRDPDRNDR